MQVIERKYRKHVAMVALCALLAPAHAPAFGQMPRPRPQDTIGASHGQIAAIIAGIAGIGIAIGVGVTLAAKHEGHSLTGCARSGGNGLTLTSDSDKRTYALLGDVSAIKPGNRVRLAGKKAREKSSGNREFLVEKVSKDLGACEVASTAD